MSDSAAPPAGGLARIIQDDIDQLPFTLDQIEHHFLSAEREAMTKEASAKDAWEPQSYYMVAYGAARQAVAYARVLHLLQPRSPRWPREATKWGSESNRYAILAREGKREA